MELDESALNFDSVADCGLLSGDDPSGKPIHEMLNISEYSVNNTMDTTTAKFDLSGLSNTGPSMS